MPRRFVIALLVFGCWFALSVTAEAQLFGRRLERDSNPEHEQKKREAQSAYQAGDFPKTIELMDAVLRENPRDSVAYYLRGSARVDLGARSFDSKLVRDGVADAREAIRFDTQQTSLYYLPYLFGMKSLASLENRKEHAQTAVDQATLVLGRPNLKEDERANLLYQRAQAQAWLGKNDDAINDLQEALRLAPSHFGARATLADVYVKAGKSAEALAAFNKLVELFPENPLSMNNRGMYLQSQGKFDDAIVDFTRAVERDPNYFVAYANRGFTLLQMENPTAAEADFTQSLKVNPQQPFVYNLRAQAKIARGDVAGAVKDQQTAVELSPKDPVALGDLGFVNFFADDYSAAVAAFDAALAIDPEFKHLNPWKIVCLQRLGKSNGLKDRFKESLSKDIKQRTWVDHLIAYLLDAESDGQLLSDAQNAKDPLKAEQTCEACYFSGLTRAAGGKMTEAADMFQRALATKSRQLSAYRGAQLALRKINPSAVGVPTAVPSAVTPAK
ncbi:MAG TPA: tetratricopeptide repeat protein [Planctomycetaceae bacterium]|nr:tetratricopeptide repeat protein [Planctomycetaceae bacterium]